MCSKEPKQADWVATKGGEMNTVLVKHMILLWITYSYISFFHQWNHFIIYNFFKL